jgi:hypothetical protein
VSSKTLNILPLIRNEMFMSLIEGRIRLSNFYQAWFVIRQPNHNNSSNSSNLNLDSHHLEVSIKWPIPHDSVLYAPYSYEMWRRRISTELSIHFKHAFHIGPTLCIYCICNHHVDNNHRMLHIYVNGLLRTSQPICSMTVF